MCDSARCSQATHHARHRPLWAEHAEHLNTVFLGNPRLSKPEQARARAAFDRAQRILTDIDAAHPDPSAGIAHEGSDEHAGGDVDDAR